MSKIGDVIVKLLLKSDEYESGLKRSKKATRDFASTITKGFSAAIGKVTALIGVVVGIAKAFEQVSKANQTFGDQWQSFTAGLRGAWDEVARSVASLDFSNLISRLREASAAARELYDAVDGMGEITTAYNIAAAEQAKHLAQLRIDMDDPNKSIDERIAATREYLKITKELESMPLRGLSRVSDATIKKTMAQMGYSFKGMTDEQIAASKKSFIEFFKWLGTEAGERAYGQINAAWAGGKGVASGQYAKVFQSMETRGVASRQWLTWLTSYANKVSDEDRVAMEKALTQFLEADAAFDASNRRVISKLNQLEYTKAHPSGGGKVTATDDAEAELKARVAALRELNKELGELPKHPAITALAESVTMPDIISDEWLEKQKAQAEKMSAWLNDLVDKCDAVANRLGDAVQSGIVNSIDMLAEAIGSGENIDGGAMVKALLSPLADACITAGMLIMTTGEGVEALRDTLLTGLATGGISAIAAGAALMAVGAAAKIGLAAITSSKSTGASAVSTYSASSAAQGTQQIESEITVVVEGRISGSDIVLSGQNTLNSWNR